jgi:hypothetical protein
VSYFDDDEGEAGYHHVETMADKAMFDARLDAAAEGASDARKYAIEQLTRSWQAADADLVLLEGDDLHELPQATVAEARALLESVDFEEDGEWFSDEHWPDEVGATFVLPNGEEMVERAMFLVGRARVSTRRRRKASLRFGRGRTWRGSRSCSS